MAKTKYEKWVGQHGLECVRRLAEDGLSDEEIAVRLALPVPTLRLWKRKYADFAEALGIGRSGADFAVVKALYRKATGYNVALNKTYKLKRVEFDPETGKKVREYEELATGVDETYVPADLRAETFWLKNRQPDRWHERQARSGEDAEGEGLGPCVLEIPEADLLGEDDSAEAGQ